MKPVRFYIFGGAIKSFYRPYKGLKQSFTSKSVFKYSSFYRPYKGLKQIPHVLPPFLKSCFYRPYKGLKLYCLLLFIMNYSLVFIVPIRDWNFLSLQSFFLLSFLVFIVPIRDWNRKRKEEPKYEWFVFIVPIRDWNIQSSTCFSWSFCSFYRPYKGLKRCMRLFPVFEKFIVFIVPIRDWNPYTQPYMNKGLSMFLSSL